MSSELKPCPFCGSKAESNLHSVLGLQARCSSTQCDGRIAWIYYADWNRRAASPAVKALVEACRAFWFEDHAGAEFALSDIKRALAAVEREIGGA